RAAVETETPALVATSATVATSTPSHQDPSSAPYRSPTDARQRSRVRRFRSESSHDMIVEERSPLRTASFTASTSTVYTSAGIEQSITSFGSSQRSRTIVDPKPILPGSHGDGTVIRPSDPTTFTVFSRFASIEPATPRSRPP